MMAAATFHFERIYRLGPIDRAALAARIMSVAQHALYEVGQLNLTCLSSLKQDLETIIAAMAFATKAHFRSDAALGNQRIAIATPVVIGVVQAEVGKLFHQSLGWDKFKMYKMVDNLTDDLFVLDSLLQWDDAGQLGSAVQGGLGSAKPSMMIFDRHGRCWESPSN